MQDKMPRLPNNSNRITIVGRTGTGKTIAAMWHLLKYLQSYGLSFPWIIYNFKGDEHIDAIENARWVDVDFVPGKKDKGVFISHPIPEENDDDVKNQMWKIWERENCGVYVDEGLMVKNSAFNALLTQGRSKKIPMIVLSQRPVWLAPFVFSESDFFQVFSLQKLNDKKIINDFTSIPIESVLSEYHSHYYDVGRNRLYHFAPVPKESEILASIHKILSTRKRFI